MITCLKCNENKEKSSFVKKSGAKPSVVCFSCWKKFLTPNIVESVCLMSEGSCLLWPDQDRDNGYYNEIRRRLVKSKEEYIHVRCNKACMNSEHFFYFKTNSTPYWFKYGLNYKINFSKPSGKEIMVLKSILMDRIIRKNDCWIFGESSSKKSNIKIGDNVFNSKRIYYETFNSKISQPIFSISSACGDISCISPEHMTLFLGRATPVWARKNLKKPDEGMWYCEAGSCNNPRVQTSNLLLKKHRGRQLCENCFSFAVTESKAKKSEYDLGYTEENKERIKERFKSWSKTDSGKLSKILSSQNRRDRGLRKINRPFLSGLLVEYKSCCYCERCVDDIPEHPNSTSKLHLEHVIPISAKGSNDSANLEIACWECNSMKRGSTPIEWRSKIQKKIASCKDHGRLVLYEKIIKILFEESSYENNKFLPRHMRNNNA